jgi:hypothetical protein
LRLTRAASTGALALCLHRHLAFSSLLISRRALCIAIAFVSEVARCSLIYRCYRCRGPEVPHDAQMILRLVGRSARPDWLSSRDDRYVPASKTVAPSRSPSYCSMATMQCWYQCGASDLKKSCSLMVKRTRCARTLLAGVAAADGQKLPLKRPAAPYGTGTART